MRPNSQILATPAQSFPELTRAFPARKHSGRECFWHISPSGVFCACARYKSMCSIGQRTSSENILRSSKRLEAVSNLSSVEDSINAVILNTILVHTNANAVHGKPRLLHYILWVV